jgi:hypothetical protein
MCYSRVNKLHLIIGMLPQLLLQNHWLGGGLIFIVVVGVGEGLGQHVEEEVCISAGNHAHHIMTPEGVQVAPASKVEDGIRVDVGVDAHHHTQLAEGTSGEGACIQASRFCYPFQDGSAVIGQELVVGWGRLKHNPAVVDSLMEVHCPVAPFLESHNQAEVWIQALEDGDGVALTILVVFISNNQDDEGVDAIHTVHVCVCEVQQDDC